MISVRSEMSRFPAAEFPVVLPAGPGVWGYLVIPEGTPACSLGCYWGGVTEGHTRWATMRPVPTLPFPSKCLPSIDVNVRDWALLSVL